MDQWRYWASALNGVFIEDLIQRGNPQSGFYRDRSARAVAIWRDDAGELFCSVTSGYAPKHADEIDELFGFVCRAPITRDLYMHIAAGGSWPEHVEAPEPDELLPHNERIAAQIDGLRKRYAQELPNGVNSEDEDAKATKFAELAGALKKTAEDAHRITKAPFLEGGRKVDATWKPVVAAADDAKRAFLAPARDYRIKREGEERKKREAEIERQRIEQSVAAVLGENPAPITMPPKKPTGLRTFEVVEITDIKALAFQIVESNERPAEFDELLRKIARQWIKEGVAVNGARMTTEKRAA